MRGLLGARRLKITQLTQELGQFSPIHAGVDLQLNVEGFTFLLSIELSPRQKTPFTFHNGGGQQPPPVRRSLQWLRQAELKKTNLQG